MLNGTKHNYNVVSYNADICSLLSAVSPRFLRSALVSPHWRLRNRSQTESCCRLPDDVNATVTAPPATKISRGNLADIEQGLGRLVFESESLVAIARRKSIGDQNR